MDFGNLVKNLYESVSEGGLLGKTWYWKKLTGGGRGAKGTPSTGQCSEQDAVDTALELVDADPEEVEYGAKEWSLSGDATYTFREDDLIYAGSDTDVFIASPDQSRLDPELEILIGESKKHRSKRSVKESGKTWYWKQISGGGRGAKGTPSTGQCSEQDAVDTALEIFGEGPDAVEFGAKEWSLSGDATYTFRKDDLIYAGSDVDVFVASPDKSRLDPELKKVGESKRRKTVKETGGFGDDSDVLLGQEQKIVAALKAQGCPLSKEEILDRIGDLPDDAAEMLNDAFQSGNQARIKKELECIWTPND